MMKERHRIYLWLGENGEKMNRERRKELKGGNNGYEMWKCALKWAVFEYYANWQVTTVFNREWK